MNAAPAKLQPSSKSIHTPPKAARSGAGENNPPHPKMNGPQAKQEGGLRFSVIRMVTMVFAQSTLIFPTAVK